MNIYIYIYDIYIYIYDMNIYIYDMIYTHIYIHMVIICDHIVILLRDNV